MTVAITTGALGVALSLLDQLEALPVTQPTSVKRLREILSRQLENPSHEKAYALLHRSPEEAAAVWKELFARDRGDVGSIEHLACLRWSQGYDAAAAGNFSEAIDFFKEGIGFYRELYGRESYWESLLEKGRALHNNANRFDEVGFADWRANAVKGQVRILVDIAAHTANQTGGQFEEWAKSAVSVMRGCGIPTADVEVLADELAERFLDRDPATLPDFDRSMARAERVLRIDPDNIKALTFVLKAHTAHVVQAADEGNPRPAATAERMAAAHKRAEMLAAKLPAMEQETKRKAEQTLAAWWEELGMAWFRVRVERVNQLNAADGLPRAMLLGVQASIRDAEKAFDQALRFDPGIAIKIRGIREFHQQTLMPQINKALNQ